jgi:tRNA 5-methylaminomethyl-2-thiouridine biosynthesis bifunctional protein
LIHRPMTVPQAPPALQGCGLPQAWRQHSAWRVLETDFDQGVNFFSTWQAWLNDPQQPRMLHYVALTHAPISLDALRACAAHHPEWAALVHELSAQWFGLLPGFHRLTLADGHVLLTLCVGKWSNLLGEQQFAADSVYLNSVPADRLTTPEGTLWTAKELARVCRRGTCISIDPQALDLQSDLVKSGFVVEALHEQQATGHLRAVFDPRWTLKNTRKSFRTDALLPGTCAVIGAGLAGVSMAAALARRGWKVQVLDQADAPAAGASGLPVGLVVPYVSTDDSTLSRLSRSGVRLMLQQTRRLLQAGQDWEPTGVLERRVDGSPGLPPDWAGAALDWSRPGSPDLAAQQHTPAGTWKHGIGTPTPAIWHPQGAWLKPAALVRAWLRQPGLSFQGGAHVSALRPSGDEWELLDARHQVLARAKHVVVANASAATSLIEALQTSLPNLGVDIHRLPILHGVRGQLSWSMHPNQPHPAFPPFPVNGAGSVIPKVPLSVDSAPGLAWFIGSSYQPDNQPPAPDNTKHAANLGRVHKLIPGLGQALAPQFANGPLNAWKGTRCVTADRLPMLGPLYRSDNPSLWICAGLGSRGLSLSVLCGELLAAQWCAEPWPIEAGLARSLNALRA